jgi:hypothetical protein
LLQKCSNLESLHLDFENGELNEWQMDDIFMQSIAEGGITLSKLRKLKLDKLYIEGVSNLPLLKLPALRDLSIWLGGEYWFVGDPMGSGGHNAMTPELATALHTFVRGDPGSPSTLESLQITNGIFNEAEIDHLFPLLMDLSSLTKLTLKNAVFDKELFAKISVKGHLPQLCNLELLKLHHDLDDFGGVRELINKRGVLVSLSECIQGECGYVWTVC